MNLIDCHSHSHNSPDADKSASSLAMIERAKSLGLSAYAITDHCE
ncbi:MAG: PHP domain-containing protein, partial [Oscillospiraceae bacterium]|nr:PHP domain-containing protein [Oscillospiraceae bacterium]